jgi:hypothetical protein
MHSRARIALALALITGFVAGGRARTTQTAIGSAQAAGEQSTGAISGVVVDLTTGRAIAEAVVSAGGARPARGSVIVPGAAAPRQITDGNGRFVFVGLAPAAGYTLTATKLGYLDSTEVRLASGGAPDIVGLDAGEWHRDARLELARPAAISGTVVDETGDPMAGVHVRALALIPIAGALHAVAGPVTRTDDRGFYRIGGLSPGRYTVLVPSVQAAVPAGTSRLTISGLTAERIAASAAAGLDVNYRRDAAIPVDDGNLLLIGPYATPPPAPDGRPQIYPITYFPSGRTRGSAAELSLDFGVERGGVDIGLAPVPTSRISGRVEGPPGAIANLTLRLLPEDSEGLGSGSEAATALVSAGGAFTFLNVPAGSYVLIASRSRSEYATALTGIAALPDPPAVVFAGIRASAVYSAPRGTMLQTRTGAGDDAWFARLPLVVGETDVEGVAVPLARGGSISGRIVVEPAPPGSQPSSLPRSIAAEPAGGEAELGRIISRPNPQDAAARFTIDGLRPGDYLLRTLGGAGLVKSVMWNGRDYTYTPFDARDGQTHTGVVVTVTGQSAEMNGSVRDSSGVPAGRTQVICFPADPAGWRRYGPQPDRIRSIAAGVDGTFRIPRLPAGDYLVVAVEPALAERWTDPAFLERAAPVAKRVSLDWGGTATQDLIVQQIRER